ncbi:glycosyl hydrolase family 61-domain-containing protein [Thelonectria olida]|uniref:lytic cellulose monooxygenase (C4-dehydrogenating) n=1 Tax=Thelonectria olida TaxID=1576542 RepID=A0A9P8W0Y4_9HYPO|nr:glycosyl hydrolase family 61-domain-containing protein [Thelonectria olida]
MALYKLSSITAFIFSAAHVAAHGHVDWLLTNSVAFRGYDAPAFSWNPNIDPVVGWTIGATDNGYVEPKSFGDPDIICHRSAKAARGHVTVQAGDKINLKWNTWPESHKGPVIDYLAKCPGNCEVVDKTELEFFKISASGLIDMSLQSGKWAADVLIANGFSWTVQIPSDLAAGNYILRHEIIALHGSGQINGAQNYPQCFNIKVTGGGSLAPAGVKGTALYKSDDPGILFNLYTTPLSYTIPGPTLVSGLTSTAVQATTSATATSSATVPGQTQSTGSSTTKPSTSGTSTTFISSVSTTLGTTTLKSSATSTSAGSPETTTSGIVCGPVSGGLPKYSQCGGQGYTGPTVCAWGSTCQVVNPYYSQCL